MFVIGKVCYVYIFVEEVEFCGVRGFRGKYKGRLLERMSDRDISKRLGFVQEKNDEIILSRIMYSLFKIFNVIQGVRNIFCCLVFS